MRYIKPLNLLTVRDTSTFGSKASMLGELIRAGLKVPPGFAVNLKAFDLFLKTAGVKELLKTKEPAFIRETILKSKFPDKIAKEISESCKKLNLKNVAVRSSSPFEDGKDRAAAGQFDSFLNVPQEEIFEAVKKVWASTYNEKALAYAKRGGVGITDLAMVVVVQQMLKSDCSGVAFSLDPVTMDDKFVVIEACYGLGEALVSGKIDPSGYSVNKGNLSISSFRQGRQDVECVFSEGGAGFTEYKKVAPEKACKNVLSDPEVMMITSQVMCVEKNFKMYVDVEWSMVDGTLYFLQVRPATALKPAKNNSDVWSNVNIAEVLPGQNYPLVVSFCSTTIDVAIKMAAGMPSENEIIRGVKGRLYFNLTAIEDHFRVNLGMKDFSAALLFGGEKTEIPKPSRIEFKYLVKLFKLGLGLLISSISLQSWLKKFVKNIKNETGEWGKEAEKAGTLWEIIKLKKMLIERCRDDITKSFTALIIPMMWIDNFNKTAKKWLKRPEDGIILLSGEFSRIEIISGFKALWRISRLIKADPGFSAAFLKTQSMAGAEILINEKKEIKKAYEEFLDEYGHRCPKEIDFSQPRWYEDRSFIIDNLRTYIKAEDSLNPERKEQELLVKRQELIENLRKELPGWKVSLLAWLAKKARKGQNTRELVKGSLIRIFVPFRKVVLKIAKMLMEQKLITEEVDIFFLLDEEVDRLDVDKEPLKKIRGRKLEYLKNRDIYLPNVITDLELLIGKGQYEPSPDIKELKGLPVSHGKIIGTARVIMRPEDIGRLLPKDIMVTDHTDPGWTPAFVTIAALITNTGGLLSHASIVAREYGLPAVVNVPDATKIIKDGQTLEVDGNLGIVRILET